MKSPRLKLNSLCQAALFCLVVDVLMTYSGASLTPRALAWGERGHDLITRVAVRALSGRIQIKDSDFGKILVQKEHMLGHISNTPDIVWRNQGKKIGRANSPTHFIDLEFVLPSSTSVNPVGSDPESAKLLLDILGRLPKNMTDVKAAIRKNCKTSKDRCPKGKSAEAQLAKTGHAPFRVEQLYYLLVKEFQTISEIEKKSKSGKRDKSYVSSINRALVLAGLMSHFVGDLANPHHTSMNYDGWLTGQGGVHSYYESVMLNRYPLSLDGFVYQKVEDDSPFQKLLSSLGGKTISMETILRASWILTLDSHSYLDKLNQLDRSHAVVSASRKRQPAQRKDPDLIKHEFRSFTIERLAMAADALAVIWLQAWKEGGKPAMRGFHSYDYELSPKFLDPTYLR